MDSSWRVAASAISYPGFCSLARIIYKELTSFLNDNYQTAIAENYGI